MITQDTSFYVTGGTLRYDAPCYVERAADRELFDALTRGEFCYVLTSRQMGKSSLMVHTAVRLRQYGIGVAVVDLTSLGQNLSVEQWYEGLLGPLGIELDLEDELEAFWEEHARLAPLQRWLRALREVILARTAGRIVIFLDEIDAVRSLPFSTDEFFAAIRECYNRRTADPDFERLTFCLLGVATPSDLIQDTRTTPFNIGHRIELTDFTPVEAAPLAAGLVAPTIHEEHEGHEVDEEGGGRLSPSSLVTRHSSLLLERILYWTGGHPYLTQRLCQAIAQNPNPKSKIQNPKSEVDRHCEALFLSPRARGSDDNLLFVRDRLVRSEADPAALLDLYAQVRRGVRVRDEDTNQLVGILRLSGVIRVVDGCLQVRNRIYARVFDQQWVIAHMPDAELRRQQTAFRRGLVRAALIAALVIVSLAALSAFAWQQNRFTQRLLYVSDMSRAATALSSGNGPLARAILRAHLPAPLRADLRGWEWQRLWRRAEEGDALQSLRLPADPNGVALSRDGRKLAAPLEDGTVWLGDFPNGRRTKLRGHTGSVLCACFSPDGRLLATGGKDQTLRLWDVATARPVGSPRLHPFRVSCIAFTPDGSLIAAGSDLSFHRAVSPRAADLLSRIWLWPVGSSKLVRSFRIPKAGGIASLAFSPGGARLAVGCYDPVVRLLDVRTGRLQEPLVGHAGSAHAVAFSPDGQLLLSASSDATARLWRLSSHTSLVLRGSGASLSAAAFAPDGRTVVTGGRDRTVRLWSVSPGGSMANSAGLLLGHLGDVTGLVVIPGGQQLISTGRDGTLRFWRIESGEGGLTLRGPGEMVSSLAFTPDGRTLAVGSWDHTVRLWDAPGRRWLPAVLRHREAVGSVAFSPNGRRLAVGTGAWNQPPGTVNEVAVWELSTAKRVATLPGQATILSSLVFNSSGILLAAGGMKGELSLWDAGSWRRLWHTVPRSEGLAVASVQFAADGKMLFSSMIAGSILRWKIPGGQPLGRPYVCHSIIFDSSLSPDGRWIAIGYLNGAVELWDMTSSPQQQPVTLTENSSCSGPVRFSPDGKTLAAGYQDGKVRLWSLATWPPQQVDALDTGGFMVTSLAFSPDGANLAAGSANRTVRLWSAAVPNPHPAPEVAASRSR